MNPTNSTSFDTVIDRRGTNSAKWDGMEAAFGVPPENGLAMWIADMDFAAPEFLQSALRKQIDIANYGYFSGMPAYYDAVANWMETRHGWKADPEWMFTTFGLGHGIAMTIQCFTDVTDHIAVFSPVYHEFGVKVKKTRRTLTELPLVQRDGLYEMDFAAYEGLMTGKERMILVSSPHNPAGRVWTQQELTDLAAFCIKHDLLIVSDEIHHDLVFPGHKHIPMPIAAPEIKDRLIMTTSGSKTFNIAGARTGCVSIPDSELRKAFAAFHRSFDISPNLFGVLLTKAAYSDDGAQWVDELCAYLAANAALLTEGLAAIPGIAPMPMQSTYLSWVDFAGTGMDRAEIHSRIYKSAEIAATPGHTLGIGGESFMRFNIGTPRVNVQEAVDRLQTAFSDLQ
ncbi:MAG: PatB family C-S lyase [Pseudoruegeria sp.]